MITETVAHAAAPRHVWHVWAGPAAAGVLVLLDAAGIVQLGSGAIAFVAAALLLVSVFAAVHHADVLAERVGQPFGSILLAIAVTVIETSLIVSIMLSAGGHASEGVPGDEVLRDAVFAALMLILNGILGLCLLIGGWRHREQAFQSQGAAAALGVLGTLATLALILPNYTLAEPGPFYAPPQLIFVAVISVVLYALFLFAQTVRHRADFLDTGDDGPHDAPRPSGRATAASGAVLLVALVAVVLIAEDLSPAVEGVIRDAGLPGAVVGVVIAAVVLLPEGVTALRAAWTNRPQTAINLALGSALASIGLTIPTVAVVSLWLDLPLALGLEKEHVALLVLSLFIATLTLARGRTTVLQGGVHLVIFGAFLTIAVMP